VTERLCLRCDWAGETEADACPRCGAPLYRMGSEQTRPRPAAPNAPAEPPPLIPEARAVGRERDPEERDRNDEVVSSHAAAEGGRWRVIALALTLTAVVAFALTRDGEPDPAGDRAAEEQVPTAPTGPGTPAPASGLLPTCSGEPGSPSDLPPPADVVPGATADYLFQDALASALGNPPDLVEIGEGSSVFTVDASTGTTVLRFAGERGLSLAPTTGAIRSSEYTIELLFRFDFVSTYRKVVDFKDGAADSGLYVVDGCLSFSPKELDAVTPIAADSWVQVVLTRTSAGRVVVYVNGIRQFAFEDRRGLARVGRTDTLRFFADDRTTTGEYSSGAVSQIRLFDTSLSQSEVLALACTELAIADATFSCRELLQ
jgi:Concanavalin A-like lectin/glucanases superfamily